MAIVLLGCAFIKSKRKMVHFQMDRVNGYYSLNDQFKAYMYKTFVTVQTPSYIIGADFIKNIGR